MFLHIFLKSLRVAKKGSFFCNTEDAAMKKYLLSTSVALTCLTVGSAAATDPVCRSLPDCAEYGFTMNASDCEGKPSLKCPFDYSKLFCVPDKTETPPEPEPEPTPEPVAVPCKIGSIVRSDGQCYDGDPDIAQVGIVFDPDRRKAIPIRKVLWGLVWSDPEINIPQLEHCSANYESCGADGEANTSKIVSTLRPNTDYAAGYCANAGYFLPSVEELQTIGEHIDEIKKSTNSFGSTMDFSLSYLYWSSTQYDNQYAVGVDLHDGFLDIFQKNYVAIYTMCAYIY